MPRGARWLEDSGGKSGRQRDERGAQYLSGPETASQSDAGPRARWGRLQDRWHGPCIVEGEAETADLTGVSVMLVCAFPSKVFWPAMDWALALLAAAALVCRLAPAGNTDEATHESADFPY